jgi:cobalt-precorrin-5B (C1)-methyltransferase
MIGKLAKIAAGRMQTHVAGGGVDLAFLADLAGRVGVEESLVLAIARANTARHVEQLVDRSQYLQFYEQLTLATASACSDHVEGRLMVEAVLFDFEGEVLARSVRASKPIGSRS